ncbi:MAG TPA: monovalent cation/H+ antiporter complex subunit F [Arenibaculum sp.]|nr:monovalent cation/H+ antiporter complex subunit F [Arenibaculum sp.]
MADAVPDLLLASALVLLMTLAAGLIRVARGPSPADRMMAAQLVGTTGVAILLLLEMSGRGSGALDVALVLALLAAVASVAFVKAASRDGTGDPEAEDEDAGPVDPPPAGEERT